MHTIANWTCLFVYLKYKFSSTSLFLSWESQLFKCLPCQRSVCANQLYISWTFWVEGNFNIINQRGKPQKGGGTKFGRTKFLKFSGRGGSNTIFDLNLVGGKTLEETMSSWPATLIKKSLWHRCFPVNFAKFLRTSFLQNTSCGWFWN